MSDVNVSTNSGWIAFLIWCILFINFDENQYDLYDLIYKNLLQMLN